MFFSAIPSIVLGIATLIATRLVYGNRRVAADDSLVLVLSIGGWTMILLGISFLVTPVFMLVVLLIIGMSVAKFREGERRALLWTLATAAEKELPLAPSVRAFASRRSDEMARRAWILADLLDQGTPLSAALKKSGNPLPFDAEFMVRLGGDSKAMVMALRESAENGGEAEEAWRPVFDQTVYLLVVIASAMFVTAFITVRIIPTYRDIFLDFGTELPAATQVMIQASNWLAAYWYLFSPIVGYLVVVAMICAFHYARGKIWIPFPFQWLFGRSDNPTVLRGLAVCIAQELPMDQSLHRLGHAFPKSKVARKLILAGNETAQGKDWIQSMLGHRFITPAEAAILSSASRAGNLEWAIREMAEVSMRRMTYRAKTFLSIASPICLLIVAIPIAWLAIGCFIPLVSLIQNLT